MEFVSKENKNSVAEPHRPQQRDPDFHLRLSRCLPLTSSYYQLHTNMFATARSRITALSSTWSPRFIARANYSATVPRFSENFEQANDPTRRTPKPNVSATNAVPNDPVSAWDAPLKEEPEAGERNRQLQAPNRASTWAVNQAPREQAMAGPRFEQTIMEYQVCLAQYMRWRRWRSDANIPSLNRWRPSSSSTSSRCAGQRAELSAATVAAGPWVIPRSSSTPTSRRLLPAATAGFLLYVSRNRGGSLYTDSYRLMSTTARISSRCPKPATPLNRTGTRQR